MNISCNQTSVVFLEDKLSYILKKGDMVWSWKSEYRPKMICAEGEIYFEHAKNIHHEECRFGTGIGIKSHYEGFETQQGVVPYAFETLVWIETATEDIYFEWIPVHEEGLHIEKVYWPGEMEFDEKKDDWYTVLTQQQGIMIPNTWEVALSSISFNGFFETAGGYMPWFGQVKNREGYIAICTTPWNAGYWAEHPAEGPYTPPLPSKPIRLAGTCKQYSKNAIPHDKAITPIRGKVLNHENSAIFRWPYHASVINTFDATNNAIV